MQYIAEPNQRQGQHDNDQIQLRSAIKIVERM